MSILENLAAGRANSTARTSNGARTAASDKPKSELWLNIGYVANDEDQTFISVPMGLPVDTQEPIKLSGSNEDWLMLAAARNGLLEELQKKGFSLEKGEEIEIPLIVRLRRVKEETVIDPKNNKFAMATPL